MVKESMKYDKDLGMSYEEIEEKFKEFCDKYECWKRATQEIVDEFRLKFKKDIRTFQRWRRNLLLGYRMWEDSTHLYRGYIKRSGGNCYFCESEKELLIHHLDRNATHNREENLLVLCPKCHHRLHQIYDKITPDKKTNDRKSKREIK